MGIYEVKQKVLQVKTHAFNSYTSSGSVGTFVKAVGSDFIFNPASSSSKLIISATISGLTVGKPAVMGANISMNGTRLGVVTNRKAGSSTGLNTTDTLYDYTTFIVKEVVTGLNGLSPISFQLDFRHIQGIYSAINISDHSLINILEVVNE